MKVLILYAHPNPQSFNHAILESFTKGLGEAGHIHEVVDLYAAKFNPCLSGDDFVHLMAGKVTGDVQLQQDEPYLQRSQSGGAGPGRGRHIRYGPHRTGTLVPQL